MTPYVTLPAVPDYAVVSRVTPSIMNGEDMFSACPSLSLLRQQFTFFQHNLIWLTKCKVALRVRLILKSYE